MSDNTVILLTIVGMGIVTYATRIGGFVIASRIPRMPPWFERLLLYIPGTIIVSIIAPQIIEGGPVFMTAAMVCLGAALVLKNMVGVMVTGVLYVSLVRHFIPV